jgi:hypothetical protein
MGADRRTRDAVLGRSGALSASGAAKNLADMGAVVRGVNDQPSPAEIAADDDAPVTSGSVHSYPMSAPALAELQNRSAHYGIPGAAPGGGDKVARAEFGAPTPHLVVKIKRKSLARRESFQAFEPFSGVRSV